RRVAQSHRQVAQPALVAGAAQRRALRALQELLLAPAEQGSQLAAVQAVARQEVRLRGRPGETVPGTCQLAVVAAEHPVADQRAQLRRNRALELDGQVGNAAARIQLARADDGPGGADVQTGASWMRAAAFPT